MESTRLRMVGMEIVIPNLQIIDNERWIPWIFWFVSSKMAKPHGVLKHQCKRGYHFADGPVSWIQRMTTSEKIQCSILAVHITQTAHNFQECFYHYEVSFGGAYFGPAAEGVGVRGSPVWGLLSSCELAFLGWVWLAAHPWPASAPSHPSWSPFSSWSPWRQWWGWSGSHCWNAA